MNNSMVTKYNSIKYIPINLTIILIIFIFSMTSCGEPSPYKTPLRKYWDEHPEGSVYSDDLKLLQTNVPFTIVIPGYLPEELSDNQCRSEFHYSANWPDLSIYRIEFSYETAESQHKMFVEEKLLLGSWRMTTLSGIDYDVEHIFIHGLGVKEITKPSDWEHGQGFFALRFNKGMYGFTLEMEKTTTPINREHGQDSLIYRWKKGKLHFNVEIVMYDKAESRKIIESIILDSMNK